jgi:tetratricopeptide (TPR) repeat protein
LSSRWKFQLQAVSQGSNFEILVLILLAKGATAMRSAILNSAIFIFFTTAFVHAQNVNEWVGQIIVLKENVPLRMGKEVVSTELSPYYAFKVEKANGDWLFVRSKGIPQGWVRSSEVVRGDQALDYFTKVISENSQSISAYNKRACIWQDMGMYDKAIADYNETIRIGPPSGYVYNNRGVCWNAKNEYDKAIDDFSAAIRLTTDKKLAFVYANRSNSWLKKRNFAKALADMDEAIKVQDDYAYAHSMKAWIYATCPDSKYRDGKKAYEQALRAWELGGKKFDARDLTTFAAAFAECGDFQNAVEYQERANRLFTSEDAKRGGQLYLDHYKNKKPFREG